MQRSNSFRHSQVYVDIPPYPHKIRHTAVKPKTTRLDGHTGNRSPFKLVPFVEIPQYTHPKKPVKDSSTTVSFPARDMLSLPDIRGLPLKDKNNTDATLPSPPGSSKASQKRKLEPIDQLIGRKKQRIKEIENEGPDPTIRALIKISVTGATELGLPNTPPAAKGRSRKAIIPPSPRWKPIPHAGTREMVENRMLVREFFHRFTSLLKFPKCHRDSLDEFAHLSDQTTKAMLVSLIDLLLADAKEEDQESLRTAKSELRKAGLLPTQLWLILKTLRTSLPDLKIADPEAADARSFDRHGSGVRLASSTQLIPCIISLINVALEGPSIYDDIAEGVEASRTARVASDEAIKAEKERWAGTKANMNKLRDERLAKEQAAKAQLKEGQILNDDDKFDIKAWRSKYKAAETTHKTEILALRLSLMRETTCDQLRFAPAGADLDGRMYYILSVPPKGVRAPNGEAREKMDRWAWMVSVHDPSEADDEELSTAWYGFYDVQDIRALTKWLTWSGVEESRAVIRAIVESTAASLPGLSTSSSTTSYFTATGAATNSVQPTVSTASNVKAPVAPPSITKLCKSLDEFANFLDWACPKQGD